MPALTTKLRRLWRPHAGGPNILSTTFSQPIGQHIRLDEMAGYYIDLTVKAETPRWPASWLPAEGPRLWVGTTQWTLGAHERFVRGDGPEWLHAAIDAAEYIVERQSREGRQIGGLIHRLPYPHTYSLPAPWLSGISQGQAASALVRIALRTSDDRYAEAARAALLPMHISSREGGVAASLGGGFFPEEYPTTPSSFVLNGAIFALWGCYDVAVGLDDPAARELFDAGVETLEANLDKWDVGYWSRYDLFPHMLLNRVPLVKVASLAYQRLHVDQLRAMALITGRSGFEDAADRFERYLESRLNLARAFAGKVLFRAAVPRSRRMSAVLQAPRRPEDQA